MAFLCYVSFRECKNSIYYHYPKSLCIPSSKPDSKHIWMFGPPSDSTFDKKSAKRKNRNMEERSAMAPKLQFEVTKLQNVSVKNGWSNSWESRVKFKVKKEWSSTSDNNILRKVSCAEQKLLVPSWEFAFHWEGSIKCPGHVVVKFLILNLELRMQDLAGPSFRFRRFSLIGLVPESPNVNNHVWQEGRTVVVSIA